MAFQFDEDLRDAKEVHVVEKNINLGIFATEYNHICSITLRIFWIIGIDTIYVSQA